MEAAANTSHSTHPSFPSQTSLSHMPYLAPRPIVVSSKSNVMYHLQTNRRPLLMVTREAISSIAAFWLPEVRRPGWRSCEGRGNSTILGNAQDFTQACCVLLPVRDAASRTCDDSGWRRQLRITLEAGTHISCGDRRIDPRRLHLFPSAAQGECM